MCVSSQTAAAKKISRFNVFFFCPFLAYNGEPKLWAKNGANVISVLTRFLKFLFAWVSFYLTYT
jgi:hypothetical protein